MKSVKRGMHFEAPLLRKGGFMPSCIPCLYSMSYKMNMINDSFYFTWGIWGYEGCKCLMTIKGKIKLPKP